MKTSDPSPPHPLESALDMGRLLPPCYEGWGPVLRDSLHFFVERLQPARQVAIFMEQASMGASATTEERFVALLRHCPTLHKLGQVVSRDGRLAAELRTRLQELESLPPAAPTARLLPELKRELEDVAELSIADGPTTLATGSRTSPGQEQAPLRAQRPVLLLEEQPLAEASVAVVVPFTYEDGPGSTRHGVLKLLKPGIEERLHEELAIWGNLGSYIEERCDHYDLPPLDYRDTVESLRELLLDEIRLEEEQANLQRAARTYEGVRGLVIPRLLPWCTKRVTAMERVFGHKVTEVSALSRASRDGIADRIVETLIARPFWSNEESPIFHADPHAGNLMVDEEGNLAVLDWSLVTRLDKACRVAISQMLLAALALDSPRVESLLVSLARRPPENAQALRDQVQVAVDRVARGRFPEFDWLLELLDAAVLEAGLTPVRELVLFRKALLTLRNVVADVSVDVPPGRVLLESGLARVLAEMPWRGLAPFTSREFASHFSNADLLQLWALAPSIATRTWLHACGL